MEFSEVGWVPALVRLKSVPENTRDNKAEKSVDYSQLKYPRITRF